MKHPWFIKGAPDFQIVLFLIFNFIWLDVPSNRTVHKTASLDDEDNSPDCQSSGVHDIKHIKTFGN